MELKQTLDIKTFPKCLILGMAQGRTKKVENRKMAYTHRNDAMTSAHNTIQNLYSTSHGIVMMSVSHFPVLDFLVLPWAIPRIKHFGNVFISSP